MNNFTLNEENYLQVKGTATGKRAAPNFADTYMGRFEQKFNWVRFIYDIFLVWTCNEETLMDFFNHLNTAIPSIKFTHEISRTEVNFLDATGKANKK